MLVKICGLRSLEDLHAAAEAGADLVGIVFVPGVRRRVEPDVAEEMVKRFRRERQGGHLPRVVGLFARQPLEEVQAVARQVGLDMVQLCGDEDIPFALQVGLPVLRAVHILGSGPTSVAQVEGQVRALEEAGITPLLDRGGGPQPGGLGKPFDWTVAQALAQKGRRFFLAGGLTPDNVAQAVRLVRPYGVDVSSGVETNGVKDYDKVRAFVRAAREASATC
ncbi:MAG: phosphoribosylanthranilate isomerase [Dehalococcoidia bacterium]|nr:phosphoribosylanthranilate isomerase [Dehalococcoidia bacterium]MDW8120279.1 phosphoribosylanthranilate isomerase [Chloroflexota bacterium]